MRHRTGLISCSAFLQAIWLTTAAVAAPPLRGEFVNAKDALFPQVGAGARINQIDRLVRSSEVPNLIGEGRWDALLLESRAGIRKAGSHREFTDSVNELLISTGISHLKYYSDESWSYWHLRSTFGADSPDVRVAHIGVFPEKIEGRWFVRGVLEGSVASSTRIRVGDELVSVDGKPFSPIRAFVGKDGKPTNVRLRGRPELTYSIVIIPVKESLYRVLQDAVLHSIQVISYDGLKMAYVHAWTVLGNGTEYERLADMQGEVDGLLLDYRDGYGGTWDTAIEFLLGGRQGRRPRRWSPRWSKDVVILIDDGTRSAKELIVDAAKRAKRAPLVGEPTPGHVTTVGSVPRIGGDGLLMLPGQRFALEGHPTKPDYHVVRDIRYCAGADPQMRKAKRVLANLIRDVPPRRKNSISR